MIAIENKLQAIRPGKFLLSKKNKINVDAFIKPIYTLIKSNIDKLDM